MGELDVGFCNGSIHIDVPAVYYSGQTIHGSVLFNLIRPLTFSNLCIRFIGEANVSWTDTDTKPARSRKRGKEETYKSNEIYFNDMETLAGGHGSIKLPSKHQIFPFKYQIPFTAPSSFKGEHGNVSYRIIATMVYPDLSKEELRKNFAVIAPLDLNTNPVVKESTVLVFADDVKSCLICFWRSHSLMIRIKLPVTGYCPGQVIPAAVEIENYSGVDVNVIIFEIIKRELYRSRQPPSEYKMPDNVITTIEHGGVLARTKRNFTCDVPVPALIPPYLQHCTIIDVGYFLRVTFKLSDCNDDLRGETQIHLGTVPIHETLEGTYVNPMADRMPTGPIPTPDNMYPNVEEDIEELDNDNEGQPMLKHRTYFGEKSRNIDFATAQMSSPAPMPGNPPPYPGLDSKDNETPSKSEAADVPITPSTLPKQNFSPSAPPE